MLLNTDKIKIFNSGILAFGLLIQDHQNYHKMRKGLRWWNTKWGRGQIGVVHCVCMMCIDFFFLYSFVEFLETGKINVTVPPIFGGRVPSVTNNVFSHLAELSHPYWWRG